MAVHIANALMVHGKWHVDGWGRHSGTDARSGHLFWPSYPQGSPDRRRDEGQPCGKAGFKRGDVILEYRGEEIQDAASFRNKVADTNIGEVVKVVVWRARKRLN